jgi:hypothetical protein
MRASSAPKDFVQSWSPEDFFLRLVKRETRNAARSSRPSEPAASVDARIARNIDAPAVARVQRAFLRLAAQCKNMAATPKL